MHRWILILGAGLLSAVLFGPVARAADATTYPFHGSFEDATFALENAILNKGLVIDYVSHASEMLSRTRADMGSKVVLFDNADIYMFCSASLSRKMLEADALNISQCPYNIFVIDRKGKVEIGYRHYPKGIMQQVQALLDQIVRDAVSE